MFPSFRWSPLLFTIRENICQTTCMNICKKWAWKDKKTYLACGLTSLLFDCQMLFLSPAACKRRLCQASFSFFSFGPSLPSLCPFNRWKLVLHQERPCIKVLLLLMMLLLLMQLSDAAVAVFLLLVAVIGCCCCCCCCSYCYQGCCWCWPWATSASADAFCCHAHER